MNKENTVLSSLVHHIYYEGIKPCVVEQDAFAVLVDPVFHISRHRVVAETLSAILRLNLEEDTTLVKKLFRFLLSTQNPDGSWSEIHPRYNQPSALITSIVGQACLLGLRNDILADELSFAVNQAKRYVLECERTPGFFLKSSLYTADHLNVDATCGAFLACYADVFDDESCAQAALRAGTHIVDHQWQSGVYPYAVDKGNYAYIQDVACLHYQGVTLYYLSQIHAFTKDEGLKQSLLQGGNWLAAQQQRSGRFDWSKSGLLFALYLTGAYAFAFASFTYLAQFEKRYTDFAQRSLVVLAAYQSGLVHRWEQDSWLSLPRSVFDSIQSATLAGGTVKQSFFGFLYALYRQLARRRYAETVDETLFNVIVSLLRLNVSTIEPFANYPDLFMSSEIVDCVSSGLMIMCDRI